MYAGGGDEPERGCCEVYGHLPFGSLPSLKISNSPVYLKTDTSPVMTFVRVRQRKTKFSRRKSTQKAIPFRPRVKRRGTVHMNDNFVRVVKHKGKKNWSFRAEISLKEGKEGTTSSSYL
ncbi:hypothetical protein RUM44_006584 [Polyplax serrata]|uniref:Uncharacterized protein n=1 Tax=Polyplax serrata TaxID=468196 RepID=A0ABR1AIJ7_POLSC